MTARASGPSVIRKHPREFQDRKAKAFECHKTQFKDRDRFYQMLERRGGREFFHLAIDRSASVPDAGDILA